jgi:signal transduction histidine kinase
VKSRLLWKLLGIIALVLGVVISILWLSIDYLASDYFMRLMKDFNIPSDAVQQMFLSAVHRSFIWASLTALVLALVLCFFLTRRVLEPLSEMTSITRDIASGNYSTRVKISSEDEIGQLATAFNRMAENLERIEHLRKTMVIDAAHELRTPLTNIRGYLEGLSDGVVPPTKETFELLSEETLRLAKLVEDVLELAKADASRGTLRSREINLQELAKSILDLFQPKFASKGIVVEREFPDAEGVVRADPEKLSQVLRNLLQNAWQYTPYGGKLRVCTERLSGSVKMTFVNTGEGIAKEDLPFIFERFYRGEKSRSREHGGPGIGLAIVKELIEAHKGEVGAESSSSDIRIWFTLPG